MSTTKGLEAIASYIDQELVRLHGPNYGLLGLAEKKRLFEAGIEFNKRFDLKLLAHGVDAKSFYQAASIFSEGKLRHSSQQENYGWFGSPYTGLTGHWDFGKGLFVVREDKLRLNTNKSDGLTYSIPLEDVEAALFPDEVAEIVKYTFPSKEKIVKGYTKYALELECVNTVFDVDQKRRKDKLN